LLQSENGTSVGIMRAAVPSRRKASFRRRRAVASDEAVHILERRSGMYLTRLSRSDGQTWSLERGHDGKYAILDPSYKGVRQCLEVAYGETAVGDAMPVRMWADGGGSNQRWSFVSVRPAPFRAFRIKACHSGKFLEVARGGAYEPAGHVQQGKISGVRDQQWYVVPASSQSRTKWWRLTAAVGTLVVTGPLGVLLLAFPETAARLAFPMVSTARISPVAAGVLLALAVASLGILVLDQAATVGLSMACTAGLVVLGTACLASLPQRWPLAAIFAVLAAAQILYGLRAQRNHALFLASSRPVLLWSRLTAAAAGLLMLYAVVAVWLVTWRYPTAGRIVLLAGLIMASTLFGWSAATANGEQKWPALSLVIVLAALGMTALAREESLVADLGYRRALVAGLIVTVLLCLGILIIGTAVPPDPPGLLDARIFTLVRLSLSTIALGVGIGWLLSGTSKAVPLALIALGLLILFHVSVLRFYGWWGAGGSADLPPEKQAELRVLGYRESAMLNVATPGIILGLIASLGKKHPDAALKVAAPTLAFAIILGLIVHALIATGQTTAFRSRLLVNYIQTISLYSLIFGLSCVALSLSLRR
jgi:hypothetical protein